MNDFRSLVRRLSGLLRRRGCSREDAEDLIQDAFERLEVYCKTSQVRNREAFLVRAVQHGAIDAHRRQIRDDVARTFLDALVKTSANVTPDQQVSIDQQLAQLREALEDWPPRTRDIYLLHHWGYDYREIGAMLDISPSAVEKHVAKAAYLLLQLRGRT